MQTFVVIRTLHEERLVNVGFVHASCILEAVGTLSKEMPGGKAERVNENLVNVECGDATWAFLRVPLPDETKTGSLN